VWDEKIFARLTKFEILKKIDSVGFCWQNVRAFILDHKDQRSFFVK
jgi:hypothetical protein